ncbi:MAG TPA: UDP-2,3-diacylglucosamine diphosphatase LpxI [Verrucomicrobiae bacterium]|nr:UDP-2,3-diacylglucosamine diphosphatase LpxI [Verrucomicrobiae bacterium]
MKTIGIIAGNGRFPILVANEARRSGHRVVVCAIEKEADPALEKIADACTWTKIGQLSRLKKFFRHEGVSEAVMAGKIEKVRLFQENVSPDLDMVGVLMKTRDFKDDSLLGGIADYLGGQGITLLDSTTFTKDLMPGEGVLGKKKPSREVLEDIQFGFKMAKSIAGLDIGQTVVVKKKAVLAVEAIEGTDLAIKRGAELGAYKIVVVKVAKPSQDMRFDVPAVGLKTLSELIRAKAEAFAFEAGKTLFLDLKEFIQQADKHKIALVGTLGKQP